MVLTVVLIAAASCSDDDRPAAFRPALPTTQRSMPPSASATALAADCWVVTSLDDLLITRTDAVVVGQVVEVTPSGEYAEVVLNVDEVLWTDMGFVDATVRFADFDGTEGDQLLLFVGGDRTQRLRAVWDLYEVRDGVLRGFGIRGMEDCVGRFLAAMSLGDLRATLATWTPSPRPPVPTLDSTAHTTAPAIGG